MNSMDERFCFRNRIAQNAYSQHKTIGSELDARTVIRGTDMNSTNPLSGKFNEKGLMNDLNGRLAGFIEKVHQLEHHNHLLEREIEEIRGKAKPASCFEEEYGPELKRLRQLIQDITHQKHQIETEHQNLEDDLFNLRRQHEQEIRNRSEAESNITVLKKEINDAYQAKQQLDKKAQSLVDEVSFLKRNHESEVSEMYTQIQEAQVNVKAHEFDHRGVTAALRDIRAQLEGHTVSDVQQIEEGFRSQFARLTKEAEDNREALKATQQEIQEYRKRLQAKSVELDCAKGTREALEKQLHEVEDRHKEELLHYQNTIKELENELINCKFDMSGYLREYQDLLNVKMALDVEILSYRKLLCGEEARMSTIPDSHISLPHIYHQSPVYTLPCFNRPGGPQRRLEPQYKFVEEIITETTREIEMSEFEETGSEETEAGKDEQEGTKSERRDSEEDSDHKDSKEEEGDQMSDSHQNQVASDEKSEDEGDEKDGGRAGEVENDEKAQKGKEETEETEADDDINSEKDKNTQSKVLLSESLDEDRDEHHKTAKNTAEKETADQTDLASKLQDLKPEIPVEGESLNKSEDNQEGYAEGESCISVSGKSVDETSTSVSKESDETQELGGDVKVGDETDHLASELVKKTTEFTAETKTTATLEAVKVTSTKNEGVPESEQASKADIAKGKEDEGIKSITDTTDECKTDNEKDSSVQSIVKSVKVEPQQASSGDKTQTVQTVLPKTTVTSEIKELHQGAPDSSQVQKPNLPEDSKKVETQGKM